jgi:hypothetical protein
MMTQQEALHVITEEVPKLTADVRELLWWMARYVQ